MTPLLQKLLRNKFKKRSKVAKLLKRHLLNQAAPIRQVRKGR